MATLLPEVRCEEQIRGKAATVDLQIHPDGLSASAEATFTYRRPLVLSFDLARDSLSGAWARARLMRSEPDRWTASVRAVADEAEVAVLRAANRERGRLDGQLSRVREVAAANYLSRLQYLRERVAEAAAALRAADEHFRGLGVSEARAVEVEAEVKAANRALYLGR